MGDPGDYDLVCAIVHNVQDAVIPNSQSPLILIAHQFLHAGWPGSHLQTGNSLFNSGENFA